VSPRPEEFDFLKGYKNLILTAPGYRKEEITLTTDRNGEAEFLYISPSVDRTKFPLVIKGVDLFEIKPFDEIKIKETSGYVIIFYHLYYNIPRGLLIES